MQKTRRFLTLLLLVGMLLGLADSAFAAKPRLWAFDSSRNSMTITMEDFIPEQAGKGATGKWMIVEDPKAPSLPNVYAQLAADPAMGRTPLAILRHGNFTDFALKVKVKTMSGKVDQAAGLVFRYTDPMNFYALQANARENRLQLYKVAGGKWQVLGSADVPVAANSWHSLKVWTHGWSIKGFLNGSHLITVRDIAFERGKVGLLTRADTTAQFDDFWLQPQDHPDDYPPHPRDLYYTHKSK